MGNIAFKSSVGEFEHRYSDNLLPGKRNVIDPRALGNHQVANLLAGISRKTGAFGEIGAQGHEIFTVFDLGEVRNRDRHGLGGHPCPGSEMERSGESDERRIERPVFSIIVIVISCYETVIHHQRDIGIGIRDGGDLGSHRRL